ncbi:hypothetical protein LJE71_08625 [Xanthobacter autotrophicus]|uniref:hypothetical protein n=1 Tax=Xanthobacter autotrophicus TaxID=280 RepID=UPI001E64FA7D|nr:hypothetical protein [Xanthobacter autotrophicus]UDQ91043.1 hypothetical protein LJE71_08625 [Xanthobacter autotrophicus]
MELVLASRLAGCAAPVEGVTTHIREPALAQHARTLGFRGKLAIHPHQIAAIREGVRPTAAEIAWAEAVLASGAGAQSAGGAMADEPVCKRAHAILAWQGEPGLSR